MYVGFPITASCSLPIHEDLEVKANSVTYVGRVPAAIMPTLPSSDAQIPAFPYDPINIPTPQWVDHDNQYYVDSSSPTCDDSSNAGRGTPNPKVLPTGPAG